VALAFLFVMSAVPAAASTCTVRGTVTDADGVPVQGADVTLFDGDRSEITSVKTDASGNFAFVNVQVNTGLCAVRAFYNDGHQTYTNAAYFTEWYQANRNLNIPLKDMRLQTYHKTPQSSSSPGSPASTPGLTTLAASLAFAAVAIGSKKK
jgi:hypothetical protein